MPTIQLTGAVEDIWPEEDIWAVEAIMYFPNDESRRDEYLFVEKMYKTLDLRKVVVSPDATLTHRQIDIYNLIHSRSYQEIMDSIKESSKKGMVAGYVLLVLYIMDRFGMEEPSMNKAIHVAQEYAKRTEYGDDTEIHRSERFIRKYWDEYKSVAHFWAAFLVNADYPYTPEKTIFNAGFQTFLEVSAGIYEFGTSYVPARPKTPEPVLDKASSWGLPESVQPCHLQTDIPPIFLIEALKNYKAPRAI